MQRKFQGLWICFQDSANKIHQALHQWQVCGFRFRYLSLHFHACSFSPPFLSLRDKWIHLISFLLLNSNDLVATGKTFEAIDPRTGGAITRVSEGDKEDIDLAVKAARQAFDHGPWPRMSGSVRFTTYFSLLLNPFAMRSNQSYILYTYIFLFRKLNFNYRIYDLSIFRKVESPFGSLLASVVTTY